MEILCQKLTVLLTGNTTTYFVTQHIKYEAQFHDKLYSCQMQLYNQKLQIQIRSEKIICCEEIWGLFLQILKFLMIIKGYFLKISRITFSKSNSEKSNLKVEAHRCLEYLLDYYQSESTYIYHLFDFKLDLDKIFKNSFQHWLDIEESLGIQHNVFLHANSKNGGPKDLKIGLMTQCFEPLFEYLITHKFLNYPKPDKKFRNLFSAHINQLIETNVCDIWNNVEKEQFLKFLTMSIKKHYFDNIDFKKKIFLIIEQFGLDIFQTEKLKDPDLIILLTKLVYTRNRVFHVKKENKNILNGVECAAYCMKYSILYRHIMLQILGISVQEYLMHLQLVANYIDQWVSNNLTK
jgi:hypothetical protein